MPAFSFWYKGNSMCAPPGHGLQRHVLLLGPFFCWVWIGLVFGIDGWNMPPVAWVAAILMVVGIFTIATNPLAIFMKKKEG